MSPSATPDVAAVLAERLATVQRVLGVAGPNASDEGVSLSDVLLSLVEKVRREGEPAGAWLLIVGLTAAMPDQSLVRSVTRALELKNPEDSVIWLLDAVAPLAIRDGQANARLRVVQERPLVDVTFTAKSNFLTGIQRVVRGVVAEWNERHDVEFVVWTDRGAGYRSLHDSEWALLLERDVAQYDATFQPAVSESAEIVVPWMVPVVLTEVPPPNLSDRIAALAELTSSSVRLVGYDCIPVSSAETVTLDEPEKFGRYLEVVKFADRLAAISRTAAAEFEAFTQALPVQGLAGPSITACPLPDITPVTGIPDEGPAPERPVVVCIGTLGRRKNQAVLLEAAEMLWREGLDFELRLLGHMGLENSPVVGLVPELQQVGRHLVVESGVSDARIFSTLEHSRCLVFPSLHEGFGLPIVEALSHGVPVIASDFGSMREVAEGNGGLLVDPEDVNAVTDCLRAVLTDDALHARLVGEARSRPVRTWVEYADELWKALLA